jgi:hypothetical protein
MYKLFIYIYRCTAYPDHLDDTPTAVLRSHEHTDLCVQALDGNLGKLWDAYGIVGDLIVSAYLSVSPPILNIPQPFTAQFPRANIHELLAPDLLHQIIKGTFKDHLVTWVMDYIKSDNTAARAKEIFADIDRR